MVYAVLVVADGFERFGTDMGIDRLVVPAVAVLVVVVAVLAVVVVVPVVLAVLAVIAVIAVIAVVIAVLEPDAVEDKHLNDYCSVADY